MEPAMTSGAIAAPPSQTPVGCLVGVAKRYGAITALTDFDFEVRPGELVALLGPNGAGKTTAVKLLLGLVRPDEGSATLFDHRPWDRAARRRVGVMLQVSKVPETLRVGEHLDLFRSYYPSPASRDAVVETAGLGGLEGRFYGELSGGQKQRLLFALALCGDPEMLILDEPTVGLDVTSRRSLWRAVRRLVGEGRAVLLTTHYLEEADALADRVVVLHRGRTVAEGTAAEIKASAAGRRVRCVTAVRPEVLRQLPGVRRVRQDGVAVEVLATEAEAVVRRLIELDPGLSGLEVGGAGLEEAFLQLTGDELGTEEDRS